MKTDRTHGTPRAFAASRFLALALVVATVAVAASGCRSAPTRRIVGTARVDVNMPPPAAHSYAVEGALKDAYAQMLDIARDEITLGGRSLTQMMADSDYVAASVRRAIQLTPVKEQRFYDDGHAAVVIDMNLVDIQAAALAAESELR